MTAMRHKAQVHRELVNVSNRCRAAYRPVIAIDRIGSIAIFEFANARPA